MKPQLLFSLLLASSLPAADAPVQIGGRRELFADSFLIESFSGTQLQLQTPRDEGVAIKFDQPWEGLFSGYATLVTLEDGRVRLLPRQGCGQQGRQ